VTVGVGFIGLLLVADEEARKRAFGDGASLS
jgi:hypothetical protein